LISQGALEEAPLPWRNDMSTPWPDIPYEPWHETCSALHLYLQIIGKYRLARTPWVSKSKPRRTPDKHKRVKR
jgi:hypothetical protein